MLASDETGRSEWAAKERELRSGEVSLLTAVLERVEASMAGGRAADVCMADGRLGCFRGDEVVGMRWWIESLAFRVCSLYDLAGWS